MDWLEFILKSWFVMIPLSIWKLVEIVIWIIQHIKISFVG